MKQAVDIELVSRVSVPVFVHAPNEMSWMTACLVGPDAVLTTAALTPSSPQDIELHIDGETRAARIELVDEAAGFTLLRFQPPITGDLPGVLSLQDASVEPETAFLAIANLGEGRTATSVSGVVIGPVTRDGKRFYRIEVEHAEMGRGGIAGAPVVAGDRILGLIVGKELPGRSEQLRTYLVVSFANARGTPLEERLRSLWITGRLPAAASRGNHAAAPTSAEGAAAPGDPVIAPTEATASERAGADLPAGNDSSDDGRLFRMLTAQSRLALSRADAMRRVMHLERVHIEQLIAAMHQHPTGLAAAVLRGAEIGEAQLRDLVAKVTGAALPERIEPDQLAELPPLSGHAREAVVAASQRSTDGTIHLSDLFAGAMSITQSAFVRALTELGVRLPPELAPRLPYEASPDQAPGDAPAPLPDAPLPPSGDAPAPSPDVAAPRNEATPSAPQQAQTRAPYETATDAAMQTAAQTPYETVTQTVAQTAHDTPAPAPHAATTAAEPGATVEASGPAPAAATSTGAAALAGFRSDGVANQDDLLDIEHDVSALCSVIAARDVEPPLSIGLFGDWGSGKSFFLESMRAQLRRIEKAADEAEQAATQIGKPIRDATHYCARITQLEFNAWRYIDTDLWASLTDGIIDGLARALEKPTLGSVPATERARLMAAAAHSRDVIAEAEASRRVAESNLRDQEQVLQQAIARAQTPRGKAAVRQEARVLAIAASPALRDELAKVEKQLGTRKETAEAKAALLDLQGLGGTTRAVWRAIRASSGAAIAGAAVLGLVALAIILLRDELDAAIRAVVGAAVAVMTWFASFRPYVKRARSAVDAIKQIVDKHGEALEAARAEATEHERSQREQAAAAIEAAKLRRIEAQRDLDKIEAQLTALRADQQMATFLKERQASDDYRKHLGVIARARSDFERLSDLLFRTRDDAPKEGLPRIDRIVLYIDDLDRCDEEQVVKVLQAVHLLLAFKLFVVVVAVDSRWLLHALQQHSRAFRANTDTDADDGLSEEERLHWQSTPLNYLEKIFQIPFTLRPMGATGFGNLIDHLTTERTEAPTEARTDAQRDAAASAAGSTAAAGTKAAASAASAGDATQAAPAAAGTEDAARPTAAAAAAAGSGGAAQANAAAGTSGTGAPQANAAAGTGSADVPQANTVAADAGSADAPQANAAAGTSAGTPQANAAAGTSAGTPQANAAAGTSAGTPQANAAAGTSAGTPQANAAAGTSTGTPQANAAAGTSAGTPQANAAAGTSTGTPQANAAAGTSAGTPQANAAAGTSAGTPQANAAAGTSTGTPQANAAAGTSSDTLQANAAVPAASNAGAPQANAASGTDTGAPQANAAGTTAGDPGTPQANAAAAAAGDLTATAAAATTSPTTQPAATRTRPRLADTPVNVMPRHLVIDPWEASFMKEFHELIATPRATKRFVNVYRLLKARVTAEKALAFRGNAHGGEHRAAIFLLALLIGYPSEATDLMRDLTEQTTTDPWWAWLFLYLGAEKKKAPVRTAQQERLLELTAKLTAIRQRLATHDLPTTEVFQFWTPYVARFSFQAGRLSAPSAPLADRPMDTPADAPASKLPAPRRPRTATGSDKPRDRSEASGSR